MWRSLPLHRAAALAAIVAASVSCGNVVRDGRSPAYLTVDSLGASRGASSPGPFVTGLLVSDVITNVITPAPCSVDKPCPTIFGDTGQAVLRASLKDVGTPSNPASPTTNNDVTITRYHVEYVRTDGLNTPGVDVPYGFDGGATVTVPAGGSATVGFELVRNIAKQQTPLVQLKTSSTILEMIAHVTFYGQDQVGNELSVTGSISIEFGNFGDI